MSHVSTDQNFTEEILNFNGVAVVDFWAEWCGPCRIQAPIIDSLSEKFKDNTKIKISKLDVDNNQDTAIKYNVMSIPTLLFFKNGQLVESFIGVRSASDIEQKLNELSN